MEEILRIVQRRQLLWNIQTPEERHKIRNENLARKFAYGRNMVNCPKTSVAVEFTDT